VHGPRIFKFDVYFFRSQRQPHVRHPYREGVCEEQGQPQAQGERVDQGVRHPRTQGHEHQIIIVYLSLKRQSHEIDHQAQGERVDQGVRHPRTQGHEHQIIKSYLSLKEIGGAHEIDKDFEDF
jgi:hypothetical protein